MSPDEPGSAAGQDAVAQLAVADVLDLLRRRHSVLLSGPPGTGKSHLLNAVAAAFCQTYGGMNYTPNANIPIPPASTPPWYLPSPARTNRAVFPTAFHSATTVRDVLRGLVPAVDPLGSGTRFEVSSGVLYRAAEHGLLPDGAALVIIDEINRGPAVAAFGPSIVALDGDKRLADDGTSRSTTQRFDILNDQGHALSYALPTHLYILAAMNAVDTSVEALDTAFLRRMAPYRVLPSTARARAHLRLPAQAPAPADAIAGASGTPDADAVYELLVAAWATINNHLRIGRGVEYQIGHGVLMFDTPPTGTTESLRYAQQCFDTLRQHVGEVFFGDDRSAAYILSAADPGSPFTLAQYTFADEPITRLEGPDTMNGTTLVAALRAVVAGGLLPGASPPSP